MDVTFYYLNMEYRDEGICSRIKEVMRENALNQKGLVEKTGMKQSSVSDILGMKRSPMPLVEKMVEVFGVNKLWLLSGNGFKYANSEDIAKSDMGKSSAILNKTEILNEVNALYKKHQELLAQAAEIMGTIVDLNKKLLLNTNGNE